MHHFIYPSQDTFVTNATEFENLNFGLTEVLRVGTAVVTTKTIFPTKDFLYSTQSVSNWCVGLFTGHIDSGSLTGTSSLLVGSASLITGSASGSSNVTASFGSFINFSGSATDFFGNVTDFSGKITGVVTGTDTVLLANEVITSSIVSYRSLLQFDISTISKSVASGDIVNPHFTLKMKVARAETLPIQYSLIASPISESWVMGDGYFSDGGSSVGASWIYRDREFGTKWVSPGGTITGPSSTESFNYEVGDVDMDITSIVNGWISGSITNNGLSLMSSDENSPTGSGMTLYFFSNDSNTIYRPVIDSAWNDTSIVTASLSTGSVVISTIPAGLFATVVDTPTMTGSIPIGYIAGVMDVLVDNNLSASGTIDATGQTGTIVGDHIFGSVSGSITQSIAAVTTVFPSSGGGYEYAIPTVSTAFITTSVLVATILDGFFSGSTIATSIFNSVQITGGLTGSFWNSSQLVGTQITASFPFLNYPNMLATLVGPFINGPIYGKIINVNPTGSGIFTGTITGGDLVGSYVTFPFSGSISTSSFSFTSSVDITIRSLDPLQLDQPFVTIVQNLKPSVRAGNIIRVNVFGREEFPLKNFARSTQFSQFLVPKYLPTTSYYAIKDNETEEIVVDFDNYTQISCDLSGNYFLLDTTGLPQERYFKILIKIIGQSSIYTIDNNDIFKIVR